MARGGRGSGSFLSPRGSQRRLELGTSFPMCVGNTPADEALAEMFFLRKGLVKEDAMFQVYFRMVTFPCLNSLKGLSLL